MTVKASLQIVLKANDVIVAESDDAALWQQTLAAITGGKLSVAPAVASRDEVAVGRATYNGDSPRDTQERLNWPTDALDRFAHELRLDVVVVQAACDPGAEHPFMHLDVRTWEEFKRNTPARGYNSVPPVVLAATLLSLWFRQAQMGQVTIGQAQAVLNTIGLRDKNPVRGLRNCEWLQARDDVIKLNPARYTQALAVARAFCSRQTIEEWQFGERG